MSEKKKEKKAKYYVDFESWYLVAESKEEVIRQINAKLEKGEQPKVLSIGICDWE